MRLYSLKALRNESGKTQEAVARDLDIPLSTYQGWEQQKNNPELPRLNELADYFGCTVDDLLGRTGYDLPKGAIRAVSAKTSLFPVYGRIAAGEPIEMVEAIDEVEAFQSKREQHPYSYFLVVSGDSMNNQVLDGHLALIDPKAEVRNGDTVAVNVNGYDATLKVWHKTSNSVVLSPDSSNPEHKDMVIDETSPDAPKLRVLGKMVWAMYPA
jgi:repressor LexA